MLQKSSQAEAEDLFHRIRGGADAETVFRHALDGDLLLLLFLVPERRYRYEFPYLREMPAFLLKSTNPYLDTLLHDYEFKSDPTLQNQKC